jgi:hypothetical protein
MQLIGLKKYSHGYSGCLSTDTQYVFFYFAKGRCTEYLQYQKREFQSDDHFISVMAKFIQTSFFSRPPLTVEVIDPHVLAHFWALHHPRWSSRPDQVQRPSRPLTDVQHRNQKPLLAV